MSQANGSSGKRSSRVQHTLRLPPTLHVQIDWHHSIVGYLIVFPMLALAMLLTLTIQSVIPDFVMRSAILVLAVSFVALFWGRGPTLLMLILGIILLDFLVIPPAGVIEHASLA